MGDPGRRDEALRLMRERFKTWDDMTAFVEELEAHARSLPPDSPERPLAEGVARKFRRAMKRNLQRFQDI